MEYEHMGIRWGTTFLKTASRITEQEKFALMVYATEMYLQGEESRKVKGPNYDGLLFTEGRYEILGSIGGVQFDAELDTAYGKEQMRFLVAERTGGRQAISVN